MSFNGTTSWDRLVVNSDHPAPPPTHPQETSHGLWLSPRAPHLTPQHWPQLVCRLLNPHSELSKMTQPELEKKPFESQVVQLKNGTCLFGGVALEVQFPCVLGLRVSIWNAFTVGNCHPSSCHLCHRFGRAAVQCYSFPPFRVSSSVLQSFGAQATQSTCFRIRQFPVLLPRLNVLKRVRKHVFGFLFLHFLGKVILSSA